MALFRGGCVADQGDQVRYLIRNSEMPGKKSNNRVRMVSLIWTFEQSQVIVCSAWYAVEPWPVPVGQAMCSAKMGFDLGTVGVLVMAVGLYRLLTRPATRKHL